MEKGRRVKNARLKMEGVKQPGKGNKKGAKKIIIAVAMIIVLAFLALIANDYIIIDDNEKTNLIINNKNVTSNLKNDILIQDDTVYLSKQDIANFFDKYIYEEGENNQIITTYNKKIAAIGFTDNTININGSNKKIYAHVIKTNNTTYLPISEMKDVYDIELNDIKDTNTITIDSTSKEQKKAIITSDLAVKSSTGFISKTVARVKKGDYVIVVSEENGYAKIRTESGKLGYIKIDKLANTITVRENMEEEKQISEKINLVWDYFSEYSTAPDRRGSSINGINVVSPSFFYLDDNGNLKENLGENGKNYISWAHDNGYKVWPMVSNAEAGLKVTSSIMNSYKKRQTLIESITEACIKYNLDGVNIDFENMKQEDKDLYSRFIIELTPRLKEAGLVTSVDVTAPDGGETWSMCFDRNVIGNVADYIVFMAYDEYGVSSTTPGTTAGYNWVELSLNKFLKTEEIDPQKIVLAIPLYTRIWTTDSKGKTSSKTVDMKNIDTIIPDGIEKKWDEDLKQNYVEYTDGNSKKQIWIEDINSLKQKVSLISNNNIAGVASWQMGMETEEVWEMLKTNLNK